MFTRQNWKEALYLIIPFKIKNELYQIRDVWVQ